MTLARLPVPIRRLLRVSLVLLHLIWGLALASLAFPMIGPARRDRIIMRWSRRLLDVLGVRPEIGALPPVERGALLVCNHVSWLDIYLINSARHVHFVSKAEVRGWPVIGWLARQSGTLFIERGRRADTARINGEMRALMQTGRWVAVFPEGTTGDGLSVRRFMPSLLQPAVELDVPIVPAALRYRTPDGVYSAAPAYIAGVSLWQSLIRIVSTPGLVAELVFSAPIQPDGHRRELAERAEAVTAGLLDLPRASVQRDAAATRAPAAAPADTPRPRPGDRRA